MSSDTTHDAPVTAPVADWASDYDIFDPQYISDPFGIWDELRQACPMAHTDRWGGSWLPTRYADVYAIAHDIENFPSGNGISVVPLVDMGQQSGPPLLTSGVPILQAMETVAGTVGNSVMSDAVLEARARIREGDRIGDPLEASRLFPPMVVHMIGVGEESGSLDFMLQKIADFYESVVEATLASLTAALEPVMIVVLGFIVGFIVIAMFLPLIKVIEGLSSGEND